ncbi:MAG: M28 family peptidase [Gammaproteobacteria bacterium]|nr:M28 family peptidase [Gammaproteobacteria bacterium]MDP2141992.1 M28 family peptidase [Gammaproteobacteria bacterium]MDP2348429.1 M28 family peptidase [Gammaproteobacteria bacterium]
MFAPAQDRPTLDTKPLLKSLVPTSMLLIAMLSQLAAHAQTTGSDAPWFGVMLPPPFQVHTLPAIVGDRGPVPAMVPAGEEGFTEFDGEVIWEDLVRVVEFSKQSRAEREIGSGQLWGRIAGFPSNTRTVNWAVEQFRAAGITSTEIQTFKQSANASFWVPLSWELRLKGSAALGRGSQDIVLETSMPLAPSSIPGGTLSGTLIYVGTGSPAELAHIDVRGKIAVQQVTPQAHMVFEREPTVPRAQDMFRRGAIAVINIMDQPGNELAKDFSNCGGPCFNIGGRDGNFLAEVFSKAAEAGALDALQAEMTLQTQTFSNLSAENGIGLIPGSSSDEAIIINAHVDAWFDGAGDNGDGVAVQIALAKHFAKPENRPLRTLVFVASAGHHTSGLNGPSNFVSMNPGIAANTVVTLNIEHVAQRNFSPARSQFEDGYREYIADSGEAPIVAGVTNSAPFIESLFARGVQLYGTNFVSGTSTMASGEGGGYRAIQAPIVTTMQAPPLYHTSGEVLEAISVPGLERMARFLAFFIKELDKAPRELISP